jgi:hypothetical protein
LVLETGKAVGKGWAVASRDDPIGVGGPQGERHVGGVLAPEAVGLSGCGLRLVGRLGSRVGVGRRGISRGSVERAVVELYEVGFVGSGHVVGASTLGNGGGLLGEKLLASGLKDFGWNVVEAVENDDGGAWMVALAEKGPEFIPDDVGEGIVTDGGEVALTVKTVEGLGLFLNDVGWMEAVVFDGNAGLVHEADTVIEHATEEVRKVAFDDCGGPSGVEDGGVRVAKAGHLIGVAGR